MRIALVVLLSAFVVVYWQMRQRPADQTPAVVTPDTPVNLPPPLDDSEAAQPFVPPSTAPLIDPEDAFGTTAVDSVEAGLLAVEEAMDAGRLVRPEGNNALALLRGVLVLEPGNPEAIERLNRLERILVDALHYSLVGRDTARAELLLSALRSLSSAGPFPELDLLEGLLYGQRRAVAALQAASEAAESGRLVGGPGSALSLLERAAEDDSGNPEIYRQKSELAELLGQEVEAAVTADRFDVARRWLEWLRRASVDELVYSSAQKRVDAAYAQRRQDYESEFRRSIEVSAFEDADRVIDRMRALDPERMSAADVNRYRDRLAFARIYGVYAPGDVFSDRIDGGMGPSMAVIPAGEFTMGAVPGDSMAESAEEPRHRVMLNRGFALSRHEIRVQDFRQFVEASGYLTDAEKRGYSFIYNENNGQTLRRRNISWRDDYSGRDALPENPVVHVSWNDAQAYVAWITEATGWRYRLPSEAEYEYAVRAGSKDVYWWGDGSPASLVENLTGEGDTSPRYRRKWNRAFDDYADGQWGPAPVMSFVANGFGLYDMAGNVAEWTQDCWHDSYVRAPGNGSAWVNRGCEKRVARGSFWGGPPETARASYRIGYSTNQRGSAIGFRVARNLFRQ